MGGSSPGCAVGVAEAGGGTNQCAPRSDRESAYPSLWIAGDLNKISAPPREKSPLIFRCLITQVISMKLSPKQEAFAQQVASGESAAGAYRAVNPKASRAHAQTSGPLLLRRSHIALRVDELRQAVRTLAARQFALTKVELLKYFQEVMETPAGELTEGHRLCQEISMGKAGRTIKMPGKLEAAEKIIRMMGWYEPDKMNLNQGISPGGVEELNRIFGPPR